MYTQKWERSRSDRKKKNKAKNNITVCKKLNILRQETWFINLVWSAVNKTYNSECKLRKSRYLIRSDAVYPSESEPDNLIF